MKDWLIFHLKEVQNDILCAYLYGSSLQLNGNPRDVDIIVVTKSTAGSPSWERVRSFCEHLRREFFEIYGLPLSVMVATQSEWSEIDGVVVRERAALT